MISTVSHSEWMSTTISHFLVFVKYSYRLRFLSDDQFFSLFFLLEKPDYHNVICESTQFFKNQMCQLLF
jgi:hypothetical protein